MVKVKADYPRVEDDQPAHELRSLDELYADYCTKGDGVLPPEELVAVFRRVMDEVSA